MDTWLQKNIGDKVGEAQHNDNNRDSWGRKWSNVW